MSALIAGIAAAAVNSVIFLAGKASGAFPDAVIIDNLDGPLTLGPILFASILPVLVAALVYWALARFTARPVRNFTVLATILVVLTLYSPFTIPGAPFVMALLLAAMHVVVYGATLWMARRS